MSRRRWIIVVTALVVLVTGAYVWFVVLGDSTTPLTAADLGFTGVAGDAPGDPGIYQYDTEGFDEIDALGGARHDYPAITYMVISDRGCGPAVRWYAVAERWTETVHCGSDLGITESTNFHEWFHIPDTGVSTCTAPIFPPPGETTWTVVCAENDMTSTDVSTLVGTETLQVGGESVETIHIRTVSTTTGSTVATTTRDDWRLPGTALLVRVEFDDASTNETRIGVVDFVEHVTLHLRSLTPTG